MASAHLAAGRLRHRIDIEGPRETQDTTTGAITVIWDTIWYSVPAEVAPRSGREYLAGQQLQAEVSTLITFRYRAGLTQKMRITHCGRIYNIVSLLSDPDSGREAQVAACSEGVNEG